MQIYASLQKQLMLLLFVHYFILICIYLTLKLKRMALIWQKMFNLPQPNKSSTYVAE